MRILLDECVPIQVRGALPGHEVTSAQRMGWGGLRNGALLLKPFSPANTARWKAPDSQ